jgi:hypothetical protein
MTPANESRREQLRDNPDFDIMSAIGVYATLEELEESRRNWREPTVEELIDDQCDYNCSECERNCPDE